MLWKSRRSAVLESHGRVGARVRAWGWFRISRCWLGRLMNQAFLIDAPGPGQERQAKLAALLFSAAEVSHRSTRIYETMLDQSPRSEWRISR